MSSRSTSPDVLELPTSPLAHRAASPTRRRSASPVKRTTPAKRQRTISVKSEKATLSSPQKTMVLDTPGGGRDGQSPWRIKVTVEAEPHAQEKGVQRRTRTVKVPLRGLDEKAPQEGGVQTPGRKRKGTPVRRARKGTPIAKKTVRTEEESGSGEDGQNAQGSNRPPESTNRSLNQALLHEESKDSQHLDTDLLEDISPPKRKPIRQRNQNIPPRKGTHRTQRLSHAREELDSAIRDALGADELQHDSHAEETDHSYADEGGEEEDISPQLDLQCEAPVGDLTITENEAGDFSMVSVESLQSNRAILSPHFGGAGIKRTSEAASKRQTRTVVGERSGLSVSYLPSSPPSAAAETKLRPTLASSGSMRSNANPTDFAIEQKHTDREMRTQTKSQRPVPASSIPTNAAPQEQADRTVVAEASGSGYEARKVSTWRERRDARRRQAEARKATEAGAVKSQIEQPASTNIKFGTQSRGQERLPQEPTNVPAVTHEAHEPVREDNQSTIELPPPRRSKLPRTWRGRPGDGMDFAYSDSPEHNMQGSSQANPRIEATSADASRPASGASSTGGSRQGSGSGVLTPPSTDDDHHAPGGDAENDREGSSMTDMDLGQPDGEATRIQDHNIDAAGDTSHVTDGRTDVEASGTYWKPKRQLRRPQVQTRPEPAERSMDLAELLGVTPSPRPIKSHTSNAARAAIDSVQAKVSQNLDAVSQGKDLANDSHLRTHHHLPSPAQTKSTMETTSKNKTTVARTADSGLHNDQYSSMVGGSGLEDSFASKASHERQLLIEMNTPKRTHLTSENMRSGKNNGERFEVDEPEDAFEDSDEESQASPTQQSDLERVENADARESQEDGDVESSSYSDSELEVQHNASLDHRNVVDRSYEEHLNKDSPKKIRINFGSSTNGNSSLLVPRQEYPPLFGAEHRPVPTLQSALAPKSTTTDLLRRGEAVPKTVEVLQKTTSGTGLLSRFWSAITAPPPLCLPDAEELQSIFQSSARIQLRGRYGVLPKIHPWKLVHMRTLHRMYNSVTEPRSDTLIPRGGQLPTSISKYVGKTLPGGFVKETFTVQHGHVILSFFQLLVPLQVTESMRRKEIAFLGDREAALFRGQWCGQHGDDIVFTEDCAHTEMRVSRWNGNLTVDFVARALASVVYAQQQVDLEEDELDEMQDDKEARWDAAAAFGANETEDDPL